MSTSPYDTPAWDDADYELLGQEPPSTRPLTDRVVLEDDATDGGYLDEAQSPHASGSTAYGSLHPEVTHAGIVDQDSPAFHRSTEYAAMPGMPGRGVVLLTSLVTAGVVALDLWLTGGLSIFFALCFVVICLVAAMAVRRHDIFVAGVLPPLVYGAAIGGVALLAPTALLDSGSLSQTFMTGLAEHAAALVAGYGVALVIVGARVVATRRR